MSTIIKIKRGLKENLPTLAIGELAFCTDTNEFFIGTTTGNQLLNEDPSEPYVLDGDFQDHVNDDTNPHSVTAEQVGLGNVDNTADLDKPISTDTQTALDGKEPANANIQTHISSTNNPHGVTASQVGLGNVDNVQQIPLTQKGAVNGVAELNAEGIVPSTQLPSFVSSVQGYDNLASFPETGEEEVIYKARDTNLIYRWDGTDYTEISPSLALGETSATAYRGDRGKIAFDHSSLTDNPHNVTAAQVGAAPASHSHGAITNTGTITTNTTIGNNARFAIVDTSNRVRRSTLTFGTGTTTFLANNGTWQSPPVPDLPNQASISDATDTGSVTTTHTRQVNASQSSKANGVGTQVNASNFSEASGFLAQVNASTNSEVSNLYSQVNASDTSEAIGESSQVNASYSSTASGRNSQVNASEFSTASQNHSMVTGSQSSTASGFYSQVNASQNSIASGGASQVNASQNSNASGNRSQVNASFGSTASGFLSQVNASQNSEASGFYSQVNASFGSTASGELAQVNASWNCEVSGFYSQVNASEAVLNNFMNSMAGGYGGGSPSAANRKWHIFSDGGNIQIAGTLSSNVNFSDFAELFPNATGKEQGYGLLQTLDGYGVRPAQEGERVFGVVSATAGILLNDTSFHWQGRYLVDEFGAKVMETIKDPHYKLESDYLKEYQERHPNVIIVDEMPKEKEEGKEYQLKEDVLKTYPNLVKTEKEIPLIEVQKENPDYDIEREQISRKDRPDEWTVVGLTGQVYVRLNKDVKPGDSVKAWQDGIGQTSEEDTNLIVMKITQPYDSKKGYAIGFCLIK